MISRHTLAHRMQLLSSAAVIVLACLVASGARAQDIEPRKWSDTPVGVNFLIVGYAYTQGGISFDPSLPISNPHLETNSGGLGFARSLDLWGFSGKFNASVPYTWLSGSADYLGRPVQRTVNGFGNPEFELSVNLYGAPAVGMKDFASYKQDWIVGVALKVSAPSGQYDDTRLVNIATHRWFFKPSLGVSKAVGRGYWSRRRGLRSTRTTRISTAALRDRRLRFIRFKGTSSAVFATGSGPQWTPRITQAADRRSMRRRTMICSRTGASALRLRSRSTHAIRSNSTPAMESRPAPATATNSTVSRGSIAGAAESPRSDRIYAVMIRTRQPPKVFGSIKYQVVTR